MTRRAGSISTAGLTIPRIARYFLAANDALGTRVVSTIEDYRSYADECFGWARTARTERERGIFIQMARTWLEAAARARAKVQSPDLAPGNSDIPQTAK
jgi:hypothetical protein